jgi:hypothetical protein
MKIPFACPSCGQSGTVEEALVGRQVRCKPCQHRFVVPGPTEAEGSGGYLLDQPERVGTTGQQGNAVFVSSRGDEPSVFTSPRKLRATRPSSGKRKSRNEGPEFAWGTWLIRVGAVAVIVIAAIAFFAPRGQEIAGSTLVFLGTAMFLLGFAVGAYGAFSEDFIYGIPYLFFPIYTAYYHVTRWEDLWKWSVCSVVGVGLVSFGTAMLPWSGVVE